MKMSFASPLRSPLRGKIWNGLWIKLKKCWKVSIMKQVPGIRSQSICLLLALICYFYSASPHFVYSYSSPAPPQPPASQKSKDVFPFQADTKSVLLHDGKAPFVFHIF